MMITDRLKSNSFKFNNITIGGLNLQGGFTTKAKMKEFKSITDKCHIFGLQEACLKTVNLLICLGLNTLEVKELRVARLVEILMVYYCFTGVL